MRSSSLKLEVLYVSHLPISTDKWQKAAPDWRQRWAHTQVTQAGLGFSRLPTPPCELSSPMRVVTVDSDPSAVLARSLFPF